LKTLTGRLFFFFFLWLLDIALRNRAKSASVSSFLPGMISDMWEPTRDFAFLKLPVTGVQSLCAFSRFDFVLFCFFVLFS